MNAIRDLQVFLFSLSFVFNFFQAENFRVKEMLQKEKGADRLSLNKAAIKHKLDLLEGRLNYWKEFHRKLQREERKAFQE